MKIIRPKRWKLKTIDLRKGKYEQKYFGMSIPMLLALSIGVLATTYLGVLTTDIVGGVALMLVIGVILNEIGDRIPIWNTYVGGGLVLAFLGTAALKDYKVIPEQYIELMDQVTSDMGILNLFIIVLITGSILGLNRELMLKSFAGYIPAILGGLAGASLLGILGGMVFGVSPTETLIKYVLPVMGGEMEPEQFHLAKSMKELQETQLEIIIHSQ